ncbi:MAG: hypothetical protein HY430_03765 [Candidatus Levybacteria bacterium]|nr:hypothetical protein [Candidatus Levybacteria bacterium]
MKKLFALIATILLSLLLLTNQSVKTEADTFWEFKSIDTMKYSRDRAREKLNDDAFDAVIDQHMVNIAQTGATHVGIATPYDDEFYSYLVRWVNFARKHNLKIWFRGNWSGWEGWFKYPKISRVEHIEKTKQFILSHPELFQDGDVFSACPECENGGPGDPRLNKDIQGHRKFLIDEYLVTKDAFQSIGKNVATNYNSMNGDVARLIMDRETTKALGGLVVIDHYVASPDQLVSDIRQIAAASAGNVVLGEWGAPILDINGKMTEEEQTRWIEEALMKLILTRQVKGLNYWTYSDSSTALWKSDGTPKQAVSALTRYYNPKYIGIAITNTLGERIKNAQITTYGRVLGPTGGKYVFPYFGGAQELTIKTKGYKSLKIHYEGSEPTATAMLEPTEENMWYKIKKLLKFVLPF